MKRVGIIRALGFSDARPACPTASLLAGFAQKALAIDVDTVERGP